MNRPVRPVDDVVTSFRDGTVTLRKNRREDGFTNSLLEIGYQGIRKGDLVIHAMDAFAGAIGVSDSDGKSTPVYSACVPLMDANSHYYCRLLRHMSRGGYIEALARGIRERSSEFRFEQFANLSFPVPPRAEQDAIVAFLESKEQEIQTFIANKRRTIELLKEQKIALITRAVTRGLNPDVVLKPSGDPLGSDIPKHWKRVELRRVARFVTSGSRDWSQYFADTGALFIQSGNLGRSLALNVETTQHVRPPKGAEGERTLVRRNDVLVCVTGALTGNVIHITEELEEAYINQHVSLVRFDERKVLPRFAAYHLWSKDGQTQFTMT